MKKTTRIAITGAVALALGSVVTGQLPGHASGFVSVAAAADEGKDKGPTVTREAGKLLKEAQDNIKNKKYDDALHQLEQAKTAKEHNDYDVFVAQSLTLSILVGEKKLTDAVKVMEELLPSKYLPEAQKKIYPGQIANIYYGVQNYDKAIEWGKQSDEPQSKVIVAQSYYLKNDFKGTQKYVTDLVESQIKAGAKPTEQMLNVGLSAATKLEDSADQSRWFERLVAYYPKPEYWQNLLVTLYRTKMPDRSLLQVLRLAADVGSMKTGDDYNSMAQLALDAGSPGEAVATLQKGFDTNAFVQPADKNRNQHLLETAKKQADADQPTLAKGEAEAANDTNGERLVGVGTGYFGYGQYDKAVTNLTAGIAKGGLKDQTGAELLLGVALYKSGKKAEAVAQFRKVKGDPILERVANLWSLHVKS